MAIFHGVDVVDVPSGGGSIPTAATSIIGLIGYAPRGAKQTLTICNTTNDDSQFGVAVEGFSIPRALTAIRANGGGTVVVVNVFDYASMTATVTAETHTTANGKAQTGFAPIPDASGTIQVTVTNSAGSTTFVKGTDYKINDTGLIQVLNFTAIPDGTGIKVTYKKLDDTQFANSDIIGAVTSGVYTGLQLFDTLRATKGIDLGLLIAPYYSQITAIQSELIVKAELYKCLTICDPTSNTKPGDIPALRAGGGLFQSTSNRVIYMGGTVQAYNATLNIYETQYTSSFYAGLVAKMDNELGFWYSPSNLPMNGIVNARYPATCAIDDAAGTTEATQINQAGIVTLVNFAGISTWGNYTAAYPSSTAAISFIPVRRVVDVIARSIKYSMLPFIDKPLNQALIDSIKGKVNAYINTLIGRGALLQGSECLYVAADNPSSELALGRVVFRINAMSPTPAQSITFRYHTDEGLISFV